MILREKYVPIDSMHRALRMMKFGRADQFGCDRASKTRKILWAGSGN